MLNMVVTRVLSEERNVRREIRPPCSRGSDRFRRFPLLYPKVNGEEGQAGQALGRPLFLFTVDPSWRSVYSRLDSFQRIGFVGTLVYQPLSWVCPSSRLQG